MTRKPILLCLAGCLAALPVWAGNGHLLHGIGPVNSSMGGAGVGLPTDAITAVYTNPALLKRLQGTQVAFGTEFFKDGPKLRSTGAIVDPDSYASASYGDVTYLDDGAFFTQTNVSDTNLGVIPSFGWSFNPEGKRWALGFGLLGFAAFRTDWPGVETVVGNDPPGSPLFQHQPFGYGRTQTDLAITKIPFAIAWDVNDRFSIGFALNIFRGTFAVAPFPIAPADCSVSHDTIGGSPEGAFGSDSFCYFPPASQQVAAWAITPQLGLFWQITDKFSLGFNYLAPQDFDGYDWNSYHANPALPNFNEPYAFSEDVDGPQSFTFGIGIKPNPKLGIAIDTKFVEYSSTNGFKSRLFDADRRVLTGVGWGDIWIVMAGLQYELNEKYTFRAGLNFNDTPIDKDFVFQSLGTPSTFQEHYTIGVGIHVNESFILNFAGYYTPRDEVSGQILTKENTRIPNSEFAISDYIVSALVGFEWHFNR